MKMRKAIVPAGVLVGFAIVAIMLFILPLVVANVRIALTPTLATLNDSAVNTSITNVATQFNNAITLLAVTLIVGAAAIIVVVASGLGGGGFRR